VRFQNNPFHTILHNTELYKRTGNRHRWRRRSEFSHRKGFRIGEIFEEGFFLSFRFFSFSFFLWSGFGFLFYGRRGRSSPGKKEELEKEDHKEGEEESQSKALFLTHGVAFLRGVYLLPEDFS
jgi:hypothetical protein